MLLRFRRFLNRTIVPRTLLLRSLLIVASCSAASTLYAGAAQIADPLAARVEKRGLMVEIKEITTLPDTRGLRPPDQDVNPAGTARISYIRDLPDGRRFVNDSRGLLYLLDRDNRPTVYADVGAVFVDAGYAPALAVVEKFWGERMLARQQMLRDPKTTLQEWAQGHGLPTPSYNEVERTGPHHNPVFRVAVDVAQRESAEGVGRSKRAAEQAAAAAMLTREGVAMDAANG